VLVTDHKHFIGDNCFQSKLHRKMKEESIVIYELDKSEYEKVRHLFNELDYNLIISAIIERTSPGRIYVDDVVTPETIFLCSVEGYYLSGYADNDSFNKALNSLIFEKFFAGDTVRKDETDISIGFHPDSWENKMEVIFRPRTPLKALRRHYVCRELKAVDWKSQVPEGFSIRRADKKLLETQGLVIPNHVTDWMKTNWGSVRDFLQKGLGFCMLHDKKVVSWSIADCVSGDACEIGIHTHPDYRRRGLATLTAAATVDYCLSSGFTAVGWHCDEYNLGSIGVAEKVGFELERKYIQYFCIYNEANHLAETGLAFFRAKQYRAVAECMEKVFATPREEMPDWMIAEFHLYYHLAARARAALGNRDKAFGYLDEAVNKGWTDIEATNRCPEFRIFHETQEWKNLMAWLEGKKA